MKFLKDLIFFLKSGPQGATSNLIRFGSRRSWLIILVPLKSLASVLLGKIVRGRATFVFDVVEPSIFFCYRFETILYPPSIWIEICCLFQRGFGVGNGLGGDYSNHVYMLGFPHNVLE